MIVRSLRGGASVVMFGLCLASPSTLHNSPAAAGSMQTEESLVSSIKLGEYEFHTYCAVCHGTDAKGNGIFASVLTTKPSDLTIIRKKNGGEFPRGHVSEAIDGRAEVKAHGSKAMPIWGDWFNGQIAYQNLLGGEVKELAVKARVDALVIYLENQQLK
jgi:mono/diheme cytochrome c family protein